MLLDAGVGIVCTIPGAVDRNDGKSVFGAGRIGKTAALLTLSRGKGCNHRFVVVGEIGVDFLKILLRGAAGRNRNAVGGIEVHPVRIVQVMIAGRDIDVQIRHFLFPEFFELFSQILMPFLFPIFCQVAGNEKYIWVILLDGIQQCGQECLAFGKHFTVAVKMLRKISRILD